MKIKDLLNQKIDLLPFLLGPFQAVIDLFRKGKSAKQAGTGYNVIHHVQGRPIIIKSEKIMGRFETLYSTNLDNNGNAGSSFELDMIKMGIKREICDEIIKSDLFEWDTEQTPTGTIIKARIIINKF